MTTNRIYSIVYAVNLYYAKLVEDKFSRLQFDIWLEWNQIDN